jgi:glycosyltransferase involved in cell wall biosynthesis
MTKASSRTNCRPLRILHAVEKYSPSVGGAQEVVRQVSRHLALRGHHVTVATSFDARRKGGKIDGVNVVEFRVSGNAVRGIRGDVKSYREFVVDQQFDVIMTYAAQQWTTDALLPILSEIQAPKILAPCGFSGLNKRSYAAYFRNLPDAIARFDAIVLHSNEYQDARFIRNTQHPQSVVIPNGFDEDEFPQGLSHAESGASFRSRHGIGPNSRLVLTVGSHTGKKGHAELIDAFRQSSSCQGATLVIIGNTPTPLGCSTSCRVRARVANTFSSDRRIIILDTSRSETIEAYHAADLFVLASAVECSPLVLFEAAAAGTPFIAADVGNAREIAKWLGGGMILTGNRNASGLSRVSPGALAPALDEAWSLASNHYGSSYVEDYTWANVSMRYERLYAAVARAQALGTPTVGQA